MRTRYVWLGSVALFASLVFADSWAGEHEHGKPTASVGHVAAVAGAASNSASAARSRSVSGSASKATGGRASSVATGEGGAGGDGGDGTADADATSVNTIDASTLVERSVGALIMGTVIPVDCGFGGQAGGADRSGSGFLGMSWTTDKCYTLKAATAWAAMGEYRLACEMLVDVTKRALKRRHYVPDCQLISLQLESAHRQPVVVLPSPVVPSAPATPPAYVTPTEMREYVDKAFKASVGK